MVVVYDRIMILYGIKLNTLSLWYMDDFSVIYMMWEILKLMYKYINYIVLYRLYGIDDCNYIDCVIVMIVYWWWL